MNRIKIVMLRKLFVSPSSWPVNKVSGRQPFEDPFDDNVTPKLESEDKPNQFHIYAPTEDIQVYAFGKI